MKLNSDDQALAESKVLILYILSKVGKSISHNELLELVVSILDMNYFYFEQFLLDLYAYLFHIPTTEAAPFMIITLIFLATLFTAIGFFDKWVAWAQAGLIIPITGFAHSMMSAALEYRKEGLVTGVGANMFKLAGTVIIFGVVSAYVFGFIRLILFGG